jgi:adenine phosphoribosyltransferase
MNIAIFVSGSGTNCENIIRHFQASESISIKLVLDNRSDAFALERAKRLGVPSAIVPKAKLNDPDVILPLLKEYGIDFMQIHKDALGPDDVVLIHDDILATGGSLLAAVELVKKLGVKKIYANCIIELEGLNGKQFLAERGIQCDCLIGIEVDE